MELSILRIPEPSRKNDFGLGIQTTASKEELTPQTNTNLNSLLHEKNQRCFRPGSGKTGGSDVGFKFDNTKILQSTRCSLTLSSKGNLHHAIKFGPYTVHIWLPNTPAPTKTSNYREWTANSSLQLQSVRFRFRIDLGKGHRIGSFSDEIGDAERIRVPMAIDFPKGVQGYLTYKKMQPLGPYRRPMPKVLGGVLRRGAVTPVRRFCRLPDEDGSTHKLTFWVCSTGLLAIRDTLLPSVLL